MDSLLHKSAGCTVWWLVSRETSERVDNIMIPVWDGAMAGRPVLVVSGLPAACQPLDLLICGGLCTLWTERERGAGREGAGSN